MHLKPESPAGAPSSSAGADGPLPDGRAVAPIVAMSVGVGAIAAVGRLLATVPARAGMAFVIVLRAPAGLRATLVAALQRITPMPVRDIAARNVRVEPDTVYLFSPEQALQSATGGWLRTAPDVAGAAPRTTAARFFRLLADTHGARFAMVTLWENNAGERIGLARLRESGGLTVVQEPAEIAPPADIEADLAANAIDLVLPLAQIGPRLASYFGFEHRVRLPPPSQGDPLMHDPASSAWRVREATENPVFQGVLDLLRLHSHGDFSCFDRATLRDRLARRMRLHGVAEPQDYVRLLRESPGEADALLQDLLASASCFFRDAEAFASLRQHLPRLFEGKGPNDAVRAWVAACARGEEAYSVAMLLDEHTRTLASPPLFQVFADDLNGSAVRAARRGLYPETIGADVCAARLAHHFVREEGGYRVRHALREWVAIALHDLLQPPRVRHLDIVCCRNVLGRFDAPARTRVLMHFARVLVPGGLLFLGMSEPLPDGHPDFEALEGHHRIYVRRYPVTGLVSGSIEDSGE